MKKCGAEIYVGFDPVGREIDGVAIGVGGARHGGGLRVAGQSNFKPFFCGVRRKRENFVLQNLRIEFEEQLFCERLDWRTAGPRLRDDDLFAVGADVQARKWRGGVAELFAQCFEGAAKSASGNTAG